jgi:SSS family solute:Na+ symporter
MHPIALAVFCLIFLLVTVAGFWAARWRTPAAGIHSLVEWGLAGRSFGPWISWFLIGGDLYTAYTVIAVPAALYGAGALGFFAVPYCVMIYPYMMVVMPRLWRVCHRNGYVTLADFTRGRYGNRWLTVAIALTGILALMPYIALQLVGMRVVFAAMGLVGELPLVLAFIVLAAYTYSSGLRAPAVIAVVKDVMLAIMVLAAVVVLPLKLGGYAHIFTLAAQQLATHTPPATIALKPAQFLPYTTLALGSSIALMLYPHTATAMLSASSSNVIRRNAAMLPAYSVLLALIALLGYAALAAGVVSKDPNLAVPLLFLKIFPESFAGFCLAAVAVGALVPAAIMSIAAANLFTRNLLGEFRTTPLPSSSARCGSSSSSRPPTPLRCSSSAASGSASSFPPLSSASSPAGSTPGRCSPAGPPAWPPAPGWPTPSNSSPRFTRCISSALPTPCTLPSPRYCSTWASASSSPSC